MENIIDLLKMAEVILTNEEARKEASEMLKETNDYDLTTKYVYYKYFIKGVKENDNRRTIQNDN